MSDNASPEINRTPESPLTKWRDKVNNLVDKKQATVSVIAHTNFDVVYGEDQTPHVLVPQYDTGYSNFREAGLFRRGGATRETQDVLFNFFIGIDASPRDMKDDTLYVAIANTDSNKNLVKNFGPDMTAIEILFNQPNSDESLRTSPKQIHFVVPKEVAGEFQTIVRSGAPAKEIYSTAVDICAPTQKAREVFEATKLDRSDPEKILINPG